MFNDFWMIDNGLMDTPHAGDLRDLVARKHAERQAVTIRPNTSLEQAYKQMKLYDISQLPVVEDDRLIGILDEEDLLMQVFDHNGEFKGSITDVMTTDLRTVEATESLERVLLILSRGMVVPVLHQGRFQGLITKIDVLNHMRLHGTRLA